jgi:hypothetical protein
MVWGHGGRRLRQQWHPGSVITGYRETRLFRQ